MEDQLLSNKRHWHSAVSLLGHRLGRWPNNETALCQYLVFAGITFVTVDGIGWWVQSGMDFPVPLCLSITLIHHLWNQIVLPATWTDTITITQLSLAARDPPSNHDPVPMSDESLYVFPSVRLATKWRHWTPMNHVIRQSWPLHVFWITIFLII